MKFNNILQKQYDLINVLTDMVVYFYKTDPCISEERFKDEIYKTITLKIESFTEEILTMTNERNGIPVSDLSSLSYLFPPKNAMN
jgi:hypothetical protein